MQKGANLSASLLFLYHTFDWLNQQNIPKLQVAVYLFLLNWSTIFILRKPLLSLNTTVIMYGEVWKIGRFYCLCLRLLWWNVLTQRKLPFKIEFKYVLFHKPAFHRLINSPFEKKTTVLMWGKRIAAEQQKIQQFLSGLLLKDILLHCI